MNAKTLHMVTFLLAMVGALNWGLVGLLGLNVVETVLGAGTMPTTVVYVLVGVSAAWVLLQHKADCKMCAS